MSTNKRKRESARLCRGFLLSSCHCTKFVTRTLASESFHCTRVRVTASKTQTPFACRVPSPFHDSCTACIVGVARGTSAEFRLVHRASCCLALRAFLMPRSTGIPHCKVLRESREQITSKPLCLRFKGVVHYSP